MAVELTEKEKQSPLMKYFEREILPVPEEKAKQIWAGDFKKVENPLHPSEMDKMFEEGYLPDEFGIYQLSDGGIEIANFIDMPGVTPEMFDWWFAWHGLNTMRYKIWNKDDHYYCQTKNPEISLNDKLSMKERYQGTSHDVREALLDGMEPVPVHLTFRKPEEVGFSKEKVDAFKGTIVCTGGPAIMIHFLRPTQNGCELRSRFFVGYDTSTGKPVRMQGFNSPPEKSKALLIHNIKEYTHLGKILPELYSEYKDNFRVDLD